MLFNSLVFILLFLPLAWIGFYLCTFLGRQAAVAWLVLASLGFYAWWNTSFVILLCGSIVFNYGAGCLILYLSSRKRWQRSVLTAAIAANLSILCYYKYLTVLLSTLSTMGLHIADLPAIVLPLGISFFTFTQIGYLIDSAAGMAENKSFLNYALFVTFFPHLIAGPILHHREMLPQFINPATYRFNADNVIVGIAIFFLGLAKKVLVADHFAVTANSAFSHIDHLSALQAWSGVSSYTLQLYFDFSGYSEMAMGLALLFNIRFPANFDSPYKSTSIIEFWQRWHMTLTRYLTLYIYNPLALWITRRRVTRGLSTSRRAAATPKGFLSLIAFPTMCTMLLIGIWHGAGLQFLIFGLLHGTYLTVNHGWRILRAKAAKSPPHIITAWITTVSKVALTMVAIIVSYVFFHAASMHDALAMIRSMSSVNAASVNPEYNTRWGAIEELLRSYGYNLQRFADIGITNPFTLLASFLFVWTMPNILQIFSACSPTLSTPHTPAPAFLQKKPGLVLGIAIGFIALLAMLGVTETTEFLYFKF